MLSELCRTLINPRGAIDCWLAFFTFIFLFSSPLSLYLTACIEQFIPTSAHNVLHPYLRVLRVFLWVCGNGEGEWNGMDGIGDWGCWIRKKERGKGGGEEGRKEEEEEG